MIDGMLACGPYFDEGGAWASLVLFLLIKPVTYFAYVRAFRYRVSRDIPMPMGLAVKLALLRALMGLILIGGGAFLFFSVFERSSWIVLTWVYLYVARIFAWWLTGRVGASIRGKRLIGWIIGGTLINLTFDIAVLAGLAGGWMFPAAAVVLVLIFVWILELRGRRPALQARFSGDPLCHACQYNLTGNISGICPECGTPIPKVVPA